MGNAIIGDVEAALLHLLGAVGESEREPAESRWPAPDRRRGAEPDHGHRGDARVSPGVPRGRDHRARGAFGDARRSRNQLRSRGRAPTTSAPAAASGFGLAAAVGVQIAQPDRPVVCVIGEGSAQYAITALWSAVAYDVPMTVLVLRNSEYAILKWFAMVEQVAERPGLDLPGPRHGRRRGRLRRRLHEVEDGATRWPTRSGPRSRPRAAAGRGGRWRRACGCSRGSP